MQRGEPAIVDKWTRAQMALENGADLVVELPFLVSVQAADFFGQGAVDILARLGIDTLSLGQKKLWITRKLLTYTQSKVLRWRNLWKICLIPFPIPRRPRPCGRNLQVLIFQAIRPNHVLALAYAKAVAGRRIKLHPIQRQGAGYHSVDRMWTLPRRQPSVSTRRTNTS